MTETVVKKSVRFIALILTVGFLGACGLVTAPPAALPPKASVAPGETITVIGNENVYGVAKQYNVSMRELIVLNNIRAPFTLRAGQKLTLPANKIGTGDAFTPPSYASSSSSSSSYSSSSSSVSPAPVSAAPGAVEETELPPVEPAPVSQAPIGPPPSHPTGNTLGSLGSETVESSSPAPTSVTTLNAPTPAPKPVATTVDKSGTTQVASASPVSVNFAWPVQGPVLSGFGPKGQGLSNDGVNIGAPKGAPVVAAANGIVVYSGNEMKGFGNLVLIRHQGGWVTAYAHLDRALVNKDAVVAQGDMIGTVGKTGNVSSPQLHFETRLNGKPVDPSGVIKAQ